MLLQCPLHLSGCITATNTEWGATGVCSCCSTTAYEAHRLRDTSACSATAALITAETLTVCCLSMLGPHFHSHYLQYPKPLTSLCMYRWREERSVYFCSEGWVGGWDEGLGGVHHCPTMGTLVLTHTVDYKQPWTNGNSAFFSHYVCSIFLWYERKNTNCNLKKRSSGQLFFGLCL